MRIDVHSHYNPPSYFQLLWDGGAFQELQALKLMGHLWQPDRPRAVVGSGPDAAAKRVANMDAAGVDVQIMSIGAVHPYLRDKDTSVRLARHVNDEYASFIEHAPERLGAFGVLPMTHPNDAILELDRCLDELGFLGVTLGCSGDGLPHDDERYRLLWEALNDRSAVVYLHPGAETGGLVGAGDYHLAADFVSPAEVAVSACRMIASGHLDRYPDVTIILATLGGSIPFLARRFDRGLLQDCPERWEELGGVLPQFKRFFYDTSVIEEPYALVAARDTFGADRILFGTDFGRPGVDSRSAVEYIETSEGLSDEEKKEILDVNADGLLKTGWPASAS